MRGRWAGSGQSIGQRMQACSWMQGVANARPHRPADDFAPFEVAEELLPFVVGGSAVFLSGPQGAAAGQECQVVLMTSSG